MITKARFVLALMLALALGVSGLAFAAGADTNTPFVDGEVKPAKLPDSKKKAKKVTLFLGVRNQQNVDGSQVNPAQEKISIDKKVNTKGIAKTPQCPSAPANGATPEQARASCPEGAFLGQGEAEVTFPPPTGVISDVTVSVFHGPAGATPPSGSGIPVMLHTYSPTLRTSSPSVQGYIVKSSHGKKYGSMLWVPNTPETGSGLITKFNALLSKDAGVKAYCDKSKKFRFLREVTYKDNSSEKVELIQKCKPKSTN